MFNKHETAVRLTFAKSDSSAVAALTGNHVRFAVGREGGTNWPIGCKGDQQTFSNWDWGLSTQLPNKANEVKNSTNQMIFAKFYRNF